MSSISHKRVIRFTARFTLAMAIALVSYFIVYRPLQLRWGAGIEDLDRIMPGDGIVKYPSFNATRGVTAEAPPEKIWPWLVQIGHQRAGWYSYDLIDNLGRPSADQIIPGLQDLHRGDLIPVSPDGKMGFWVLDFEANKWMLWCDNKGEMTWAWGLYPVDENLTRLISRVRMRYNWSSPLIFFSLAIDVGDFVMMRQCMLGIKTRAEGMPVKSIYNVSAEFLIWVLAFICFAIAEISILIIRDWWRPLILSIGAASGTILMVLWKPALWMDGLIAIIIIAGLVWALRSKKRHGPGD
jgi:hypothetical protein